MEKITTSVELKAAIQNMEAEHTFHKQLLKDQFYVVYESIKPANLIKNTLNEIAASPLILDNILGATVGLASGYLSKKIMVGGSVNLIRKVFGSILQFGVTKVVAQHTDTIKTIGQFIFQHFLRKNEVNPEHRDQK